ncbi:MAG: helix-turn-helix transcriptional regulator [Natronomonas sp.]
MTPSDILRPQLEEVEFLARSPNRVSILTELTQGLVGRYELEETTGVTRATLGRILDDFENRGWVTKEGRQYETTQLGAYVSREIMSLLESFEPVPALNEVAQWLPEEGFDFDIGCLAGAQFVRATKSDALAPTAYITSCIRNADRAQLITYSVLPGVMETCWRGIVDGDLELLTVLDAAVFENVSNNPRMVKQAQEMADSDRFEVYVYFDDVSSTICVVDDTVMLCLTGDEGPPLAVIETDDESVRLWAESTIDRHRREGERIDPFQYTE